MKYTKDEQRLFAIINEYGIERKYNGPFGQIKEQQCKGYKKIRNFINSLTVEEIENSIYLRKSKDILNRCFIDCTNIIKKLVDNYLTSKNKYEIDLELSKEAENLIEDNKLLKIACSIYFLQLNMMSDISTLDFYCCYFSIEDGYFKTIFYTKIDEIKEQGQINVTNEGLMEQESSNCYDLKLTNTQK